MIRRTLLGAAMALAALPALAQPRAPGTDYPNRPVRVIVAFAAGGNADMNARIISEALSRRLGQQFVVENRPSGGGTVAFETVAQAAPDGYTLLVGALGSHTLNVGLYGERLRVHPLTGVDHITISSHSPIVVTAHPSMNVRTLAEFRAAVAAGGGQVTYGSSGNGSTGHISSALLLHLLGVTATHVPYRGSAAAFQDLAAGRISFQSDTISFLAPHIREGRPNGIVIGTPERSPMAPDVPTAAEAGMPFMAVDAWFGLFAPAGTDPARVERLSAAFLGALGGLRTADVRADTPVTCWALPAAAFAAFQREEIARWREMATLTGIMMEG